MARVKTEDGEQDSDVPEAQRQQVVLENVEEEMRQVSQKKKKTRKIAGYPEDVLVNKARQLVHKKIQNWEGTRQEILQEQRRLPRLHLDELTTGKVLGEGGFFIVKEVTNITLRDHPHRDEDAETETQSTYDHHQRHEHDEKKDHIGDAYPVTLVGDNQHTQKPKKKRISSFRKRQSKRVSTFGASSASVASWELEEDYIQSVVQDREFMQEHCVRNGTDGRYALKTMLETGRSDPHLFVQTLVDWAMEVQFLSTLRHPNILKLRAISACDQEEHHDGYESDHASKEDTESFLGAMDESEGHASLGGTTISVLSTESSYASSWMLSSASIVTANAFLVLDRIYDTLQDRLVVWKEQDRNPWTRFWDFSKKQANAFFAKRLLVAYDIASAIGYLHDRNIMYRDLKPSNVGFDVRDDPKLFDFGLATEFDPDRLATGAYKLTGETGTIRYMAPEVALCQRYNEKADVYSFGILLWEICELDPPFGTLSDDAISRKVVNLGWRPKINPLWPPALRRLIQDAFSSSARRPDMMTIQKILRQEVQRLSSDDGRDPFGKEDLLDSARSAMSACY